jgi:hypothetical protein
MRATGTATTVAEHAHADPLGGPPKKMGKSDSGYRNDYGQDRMRCHKVGTNPLPRRRGEIDGGYHNDCCRARMRCPLVWWWSMPPSQEDGARATAGTRTTVAEPVRAAPKDGSTSPSQGGVRATADAAANAAEPTLAVPKSGPKPCHPTRKGRRRIALTSPRARPRGPTDRYGVRRPPFSSPRTPECRLPRICLRQCKTARACLSRPRRARRRHEEHEEEHQEDKHEESPALKCEAKTASEIEGSSGGQPEEDNSEESMVGKCMPSSRRTPWPSRKRGRGPQGFFPPTNPFLHTCQKVHFT